ncbi:YdcF family protein [Roseococcus sp.]|uniref:YdcF family protein n=1 Tax=Roseococcus sp. TaxID=2109646 RepID=UPI003BAB141C
MNGWAISGWTSGLQGVLTGLLLPPMLLAVVALPTGLLAWRGRSRHDRNWSGLACAACALGLLLMATPLASDLLMASLERDVPRAEPAPGAGAIVILGGDVAHGLTSEPGPLTLERLRFGAALHRATGLPILVTGGVLGQGQPAIATLMARSLADDFAVPVRWIEPRARDTRENVAFAAAMLREAGIQEALLVTHAWHMPRALDAFARLGFTVHARPLRRDGPVEWGAASLAPRPDHLTESWFALREWAGRLVYALRDGGA